MKYDLAESAEPDFLIQLEARFAEALVRGAEVAQRVMEITGSANGKLGVLCVKDAQYYGRIDLDEALVEAPVTLENYNSFMKLQAQRMVIGEFRKIFGGPLRTMMGNVSAACLNRPVLFLFYNHGALAIVGNGDRWRLAALRLEGAKTMGEEEACVAANVRSKTLYKMVWHMLSEKLVQEMDQDDSLSHDAIDEPTAPIGTAPRNRALDEEEDRLDAGDEAVAPAPIMVEDALMGYQTGGRRRPATASDADSDPTDMSDVQF